MPIDFIYYPLVYGEDRKSNRCPGMLVMEPPQIAHRHRRDDLLALLLTLEKEGKYSAEEISTLVESAANLYFRTQGSVTRSMQAVCDFLNKQMLERNIDRGYEGVRAAGVVNLAVLHNNWLFLSQYGSTSAILITSDFYEEFGRQEGLEENLGRNKHIQVRFYQTEIQAGDILLLSSDPPESWSAYHLAGSTGLTMSQVKRRLLNQVTGGLEALVVKTIEGSGRADEGSWLEEKEPHKTVEKSVSPPITEEDRSPVSDSVFASQHADQSTDEVLGTADYQVPKSQDAESKDEVLDSAAESVQVIAGETEKPLEVSNLDSRPLEKDRKASQQLLSIARLWMSAKTFRAKAQHLTNRLARRFLPDSVKNFSAPPLFLFFLAIAVPLVLIFFSVTVYMRTGKTQQYEIFMLEAQESAELAVTDQDTVQQHAYWTQTINLVNQAEEYKVTQDSRMLYERAQFLLDEMDLAARLNFRPALTNFFQEGVVVSRVRASSSGVYLLDGTAGSVMRIFLNTKGFYEIDDEFQCAPGPYGLETVKHLVDFVTLPANEENYKIMALDGQGNLLYCRPGELPDSRTLAAPEDGWGQIIGVGYEQDVLYVLDAGNDGVWMYVGIDPDRLDLEGATGIVFSENPISFFDEEVPDMSGAVDLVVNKEDLYVLHEDGHMTLCRYSPSKEIRQTECQDPAPYTDNRVGRENKKPWIFLDARFFMMDETKLPNASLYILDTADSAVYQFGFQLNLERTLKVQPNKNYPVPDRASSGFGITPDLDLFLAFDNQLFIAPLK